MNVCSMTLLNSNPGRTKTIKISRRVFHEECLSSFFELAHIDSPLN